MVLQVPQGYPDFARRSGMADQVLINDNHTGATSTVTYPILYLANIPALWMFMQASNLGARLILNWYSDAAGSNQLGTSQLDFPLGTSGNRSIRPIAPYVKVQVQPNGATGLNYFLLITTLYEVNSSKLSRALVNVIGHAAVSIPGASAANFTSAVVHVGQAYWWVASDATSWSADLQLWDFTGASQSVDFMDTVFPTNVVRPTFLGGGGPVIRVNNFDGVAKNFWVYLNVSTDIFQ